MSDPTLTWQCSECDQPVADGTGHLEVDSIAAVRRSEAVRELERPNSHGITLIGGDQLAGLPERVSWRAIHLKCDPDAETSLAYYYDIDRVRTVGQFMSMVAHVMGKDWVGSTNLDELIRGVVATQLA